MISEVLTQFSYCIAAVNHPALSKSAARPRGCLEYRSRSPLWHMSRALPDSSYESTMPKVCFMGAWSNSRIIRSKGRRGIGGHARDHNQEHLARASRRYASLPWEFMSDISSTIENIVSENKIVLFMKGDKQMPQCGFSA